MNSLTLSRAQYDTANAACRAEGATIASVTVALRNLGITDPDAAALLMAGRVKING